MRRTASTGRSSCRSTADRRVLGFRHFSPRRAVERDIMSCGSPGECASDDRQDRDSTTSAIDTAFPLPASIFDFGQQVHNDCDAFNRSHCDAPKSWRRVVEPPICDHRRFASVCAFQIPAHATKERAFLGSTLLASRCRRYARPEFVEFRVSKKAMTFGTLPSAI